MRITPARARWSPWTLAVAAALGSAAPAPLFAAAGDPAGAEFRVNLATAGDQRRPVVAMDAGGAFAVAFHTDNSGPGAVRRFAADGTALGVEIPLDFTPSAIAMDDAGDFAVVGESGAELRLQCFDALGAPRGAAQTIHPETPAVEFGPRPASVAMDADGDVVVAWQTLKTVIIDNGGFGYANYGIQKDTRSIYARRYDALCAPRAAPQRVTTATETRYFTGSLGTIGRSGRAVRAPAVAAAADGRFVVGWSSCALTQSADACSVYALRYRASGTAAGLIFRLSGYGLPAPGSQDDVPLLAMTPGGAFVAVLHDSRGRRFSANGTAQGAAFPLVSPGALDGGASVHISGLAVDGTGRFVVASRVEGGAFDEGDVLVRRFAADGTPEAPEAVANTFLALRQDRPAAAMAPDGRFVVVWDSADISGTVPAGQDGSGAGVYGQRFQGP